MPQYIQLPNGAYFEVKEGETPEDALIEAASRYPALFKQAEPEAPKAEGSWLGDVARSFGLGATGATGALTSAFGADNIASEKLGQAGEALQAGLSTSRQAELQRQAERMQQAEASGSTLQEIKAGALNVLEAPVQSAAQALGSFVPMVPTLFLAKPLAALGLGARAIMAVRGTIGAGMGAGAVKQSIYDTVLQAEKEDGKSDEQAQAAAARAQAYIGENIDQIALGTGLGAVAGTTGVERILPGGARGAASKAQEALAKRIGARTASGVTTAAAEMPLEGLQGGQERLAANLALQRTGRDVDAFTGVAGQATQEALTAGLGAGPVGALFPDRRAEIAAKEQAQAAQAEEARKRAEYEKTDEYALEVAAKYESARTQLAELEAQKRTAKKGSPTFDEDVAHNKAIGEQQKALREETDFKALAEQYKALGPRLAGIEASRFTEAERAAPTADKLYVQSPQETIPGLDAVEATETEAEPVAPAQLMEQRQYLDRLLTDNQERMSAAAASADVNAIKTLQQQRSLIRADMGAIDERLKASGFVDTAGQAQQLQQDIARAQQQLQKMAGPGFDPDKAAKLIERIEKAQAQLAELGGDQQALDMGAPRKLSDPVAEAAKFDTERTKRDLEERQQLMGQQRVTPEGQPDMFAESMEDVETQRREGETNFDYLDDIFEKALNQDVPAVTAPEGVVFSEKSQGLLDRLDALEAQTASAKTAEERKALEARRSALAATSDADPNLRAVYDLRSQSEDALLDLESAVDDLRTGTFFGGENVGAASTNEQGLFKRAEEAKKNYIRAVLQEAAALRRIRNEKGLTADEALKAADQINTELDELLNRSQAVREVEEVITQPAQMRGTKIVSPAKTERRDVRPLEQRPFAKYRAALGTIMESVDNTRRALTAPSKAQARADAPVLKTQFAETEAKRVAEERGETATTLSGELRRRAEFVRNKMARMKGGMRPAARDLLNKAADVLDEGKPTRDILDATETVVDSILRGQMPLERDLRALKDALAATQETPAGQKDLFDTTTDRRRKDQEVGVIRQSAEAFNKAPAVVKAREAIEKAKAAVKAQATALEALKEKRKTATQEKVQKLSESVDEQRRDYQKAVLDAVAAQREIFKSAARAADPAVVAGNKALDDAESALNKTREQIAASGDVTAAMQFANVYAKQIEELNTARSALEKAVAEAKTEYDGAALIAEVQQDGLVKLEQDALKRLEKRLEKAQAEAGAAAPETVALQQQIAQQRVATNLAEDQQRKLKEEATEAQRKYDERMQKGFGLPFTRRVEGAVVKSSSEAEAAAKEAQERFDRYFESWSRAQSKADRSRSGKAAQKSQRAIGPATRSQSAAPSAMRTGSAESREGQGRTQSDMRVTEARGEKQTDVAIRTSEMQEANRMSEEMQAANRAAEALRNMTPKERRAQAREAQKEARELEKIQRETDEAFSASRNSGALDGDFSDVLKSVVRDSQYDGRPTTELSGPVKADIRAGRLEDALLRLQDEGSTPFVRNLAKRLAPLVKNVTLVSRPDVVDSNGVPVEALYFGKDMQIQVNSTSGMTEEAFMHEVVHPATLSVLTADPATLSPEQRAARQEVEALFARIQNDPKFSREYAKFSVAEMVSEIMSNNKLRNMLDQRGVLGRIYDAILRMLGVSPKSVSDQAVDNIYALFAPAKPIEAVRVASVMRGVFPGTAPIGNADMPADVSSVVNKVVAEPKSMAGKIMANVAGLSFRTQFIDRFAPIEALLRKGVERKLIPDMQSFQTQYFLRFGEQRSQFLQQSASDGVVQLVRAKDGTFTIEGTSGANLANIAKTLSESGLGNEQNVEGLFTTYLAGIRAKQDGVGVEKLNFENKVTQKDLDAVNRYIDANPKAKAAFEKARDEYRDYNKNLLKFLADTGAITREEAARLSSKEYVPYYREDASGVVNLIVGSEKPIRIGNIVDQPYLKELVGGNDKILPFFAGAMQNTSLLLDMALRNLQTKDVAHTLRKMGAAKVGEGAGPSNKNTVHFKEHGKSMFAVIESDDFGVPADLLVQGMQGIKTAMPFAIKVLGYPADVLRKFVTRNPAYAIRQSIRDPLNAWLTTGGNFVPVLSSFKELGSMVAGRSPNERILQQAGAISSNVFNGGNEDIQMILRDISAGKGGYGRLMSKADAFAMQGDAATRAVLYNKYREQGMTHMQAVLGALESMNFARRGISPSMQYLSTMIPFFNAQVQGLDVIYRAMAGKTTFEKEMDVRSKLFKRGLMMASATMAYAALMEDDEAYKNATPEERAQNWFVYLPGMDEPIRLPIPFELGMVFKAIPELIWNTAFSDQELSGAAKTIGKLAYNTVPLGLPQGIKPALEVAMNYSLYGGDNIVSQREQGLAKEEQFRANTSELAKMLGSVGVLSPIQIEYLIRGYTGGLGVAITQLPNPVLRPLNPSEDLEGAAKKVSQMPILGNLFQPTDGRGIINAAYEQADEFQKASNTYKKMLEQGRRADAQAYAQRYSAEIASNSLGGAFRQQMGELAKVRRLIESSKDLTPEQKRVRIDGIRQIELKLAQRVREYGKTIPQ